MMKKTSWQSYVFWIVMTEAAGALTGLLIRDDVSLYANEIVKPPLSPPGAVFPAVWAVLYALMGFGAARIFSAEPSPERDRGRRLYLLQLAFNLGWSLLFFRLQAFGLALVWLAVLWALIAWMLLTWRRVDRTAALLQLPYLLWVSFAGYLNAGVWLLN